MIPVLPYRLPTRIESGVIWGPRFQTQVFTSVGGKEERHVGWDTGVGHGTISFSLLRPTNAEFAELEALFRVVRGKAGGFLFKAPGDNTTTTVVNINGNPHRPYSITDMDGATHTYYRPLTRMISATEYLIPVRFDTDFMDVNFQTTNVASWGSIGLVEILEDFA